MTKSMSRAFSARQVGTAILALAASCGAAMTLPQAAGAQVAGGAQAGVGPPQGPDTALLDAPTGAPQLPLCIHRNVDLVNGSNKDSDRLTVWLSVRQPSVATIKASGSANSTSTGTFAITVLQDGILVAKSPESRGSGVVDGSTRANVSLVPGRQYKITAKATMSDKRLDMLNLYVGVGEKCP